VYTNNYTYNLGVKHNLEVVLNKKADKVLMIRCLTKVLWNGVVIVIIKKIIKKFLY